MRPPHPHTPLPPWTLDFHHEWLLRGGGDAIVRIAESMRFPARVRGKISATSGRYCAPILRHHSSLSTKDAFMSFSSTFLFLPSLLSFLPSFPFLSFSGSGSGSFIPYIRCSARCEYRIDAYFVKVYVYIRVYPVYL